MKYGLCCPLMTLRTDLGVKEIDLVELVHLLQEDEGKNCVRPKTSVIRSETLPQTEESFVSYDLHQYILQKRKKKRRMRGGWKCQRLFLRIPRKKVRTERCKLEGEKREDSEGEKKGELGDVSLEFREEKKKKKTELPNVN